MKNQKMFFSVLSAIEGVIIIALITYSVRILMPQITYWKDRCSSFQQDITNLQQSIANKTGEFQACLAFLSKKVDILEKENLDLRETNDGLRKKIADLETKASVAEKTQLQDELTDIKESFETVTTKLESQTAGISEVKEGLKTAESYFTSDYSQQDNFLGEIIYNNGNRLKFNWMGSEFSMGSWSDYVYYSMSIDSKTYQDTLSFDNISRIDFLNMTESEKAKDPDSNWPMKARITFVDGEIWDSVYLFAHSWKYKSKHSEGWVLSRVLMWPKIAGYSNIKSIVFEKK